MREQDWCQLRAADMADTKNNNGGVDGDMSLLLGVQSRGERAKTGGSGGRIAAAVEADAAATLLHAVPP